MSTVMIDQNNGPRTCKRFVIDHAFRYFINREPTKEELEYYIEVDDPIELIIMNIVASNIEPAQKTARALPITLSMIVKNCADSISLPILCVKDTVREIVVLDTGSSDGTIEKIESLGASVRVYKTGFTNFGEARSLAAALATQPWVLQLDSDEVLNVGELSYLVELITDPMVDAWGLPRRRWTDLSMTTREEEWAYPDYQYRLFRNNKNIRFINRVHEVISGASTKKEAASGPHIEHFQSSFKKGSLLKERNVLYERLYSEDIMNGVVHKCPAVADIDKV